jgi:NAD(P)H-dependent FMN reductase
MAGERNVYRIPVIVGSMRRGRNTLRLARLLHRAIERHPEAEPELVDLAELDIPLLEERYRNLENPPADLTRFIESMAVADGVIITTPEYNKLPAAVLKNAIDAIGDEIKRKPIGIAAHSVGAFGGSYVLESVRPMVMNLGAVPIPATIKVPFIARAIDENGEPSEDVFDDRADRFVGELVEYAAAFRGLRSGA